MALWMESDVHNSTMDIRQEASLKQCILFVFVQSPVNEDLDFYPAVECAP